MSDNINSIYKALCEPFTKNFNGVSTPNLKWLPKVGIGDSKMLCFPFLNARQVAGRLNEVLGVNGWQSTISHNGKNVVTELSCLIGGEWVTKSDIGTESAEDGEKGAVSDSLKRAAVHFGVGAYIYDLPPMYVAAKKGKKGKLIPYINERFLQGAALNDYCNKTSTERGLLFQLYRMHPELKENINFLELAKLYPR